jgi:predicted RND superfamily exporter protein
MYKRLSIIILVIAGAITGLAVWRTTKIGIDYNFENFFPRNDKDTEFFNEHRKKFGTDNDFILIGIKNYKGIFHKDFLDKIKRLTDTLKTIQYVKEVVSPVTIKENVRDPLMGFVNEIPYLRYDNPETYAVDSSRIYQTQELVGNMFSKDGKSLCVIIATQEKIKDEECIQISRDISGLQNIFKFDEYHLGGRSISQAYYTSVMKVDIVLLLVAAFAVILIVMTIIFRSPTLVLLPVTVVGLVVIWTMALMELTGKDMDVLANSVPTILVVTGLSVAVHVVTKYMDHIKDGWEKTKALKDTITHVGLANILTTVTTLTGFATLPTSGIKPIDDFGIYCGAGVIFSFIIGYTVLPALLYLLPAPRRFGSLNPKFTWHNFLLTLFTWVINHKKLIFLMFGGLIIVMLVGSSQIKENTYLLEDLSKKSKMKKDFMYFEHDFQGTRPFEMAVWVKDTSKSIFDRDILTQWDKMETYLRNDYGLGFTLSPLSLIKGSNRSLAGGDPSSYLIPESDERLRRITRELSAVKSNPLVKQVITENLKMGRVRSIIPDIGSNKAHKLDVKFDEFMKTTPGMDKIGYKITGTAELIDKNNRSLIWNITKSMLIALVAVSIIFLILFRSWRMVLIGLIPNLIPLIIMCGTMGYLGISFKMSTAILFTVAFGIAVDDTVHFLAKLRMERRGEKSLLYAIKRTYLTTGKSMIIMTLLLCCGFCVLALSSFQALKLFGLMISFTLFMAMVNEMILMPVLIMTFYKDKQPNKKQPGEKEENTSEKI